MRRSTKVMAAFAMLAAVVGGTTLAHAAIPSKTNRITGCYSAANPTLRMVDTDAGQACASGETTVAWGGGMQFRGVWTSTSKPFGTYGQGGEQLHKGDVVRYEGSPTAFGCSSPKGSWVNVVGDYAYPCLEYPQNWVPLALDGPAGAPGSNANTHWVHFDAAHNVVASSEPVTYSYPSSSYGFVQLRDVPDLSKCALAATVTDYTAAGGTTAFAQNYYGYILFGTKNTAGSFTAVPVDVTITCSHYA
jgi:hypothetical protein